MFIVPVQLAQHHAMMAPHLRREGVILAVAEGDWLRATNVRPQAKSQVLASDIHPDVPTRIAGAPLEQHAGLVFLEPTAPLQALAVQGLEQLGDATFTHDTPRGLAACAGVWLRLVAPGRRLADVVTHGRAELLLVDGEEGKRIGRGKCARPCSSALYRAMTRQWNATLARAAEGSVPEECPAGHAPLGSAGWRMASHARRLRRRPSSADLHSSR